MNSSGWRASPVLGVPHVRQAAEYYRDVLGFSLDPVDGVFQPTADEAGGVYGIVKRSGVWIHFQIRRDSPPWRAARNSSATFLCVRRRSRRVVRRSSAAHGGNHSTAAGSVAPYGIREIVVEDLNGYRLALGEVVP